MGITLNKITGLNQTVTETGTTSATIDMSIEGRRTIMVYGSYTAGDETTAKLKVSLKDYSVGSDFYQLVGINSAFEVTLNNGFTLPEGNFRFPVVVGKHEDIARIECTFEGSSGSEGTLNVTVKALEEIMYAENVNYIYE